MSENDIILMIGAVLATTVLIWTNINKLAPKLENTTQTNKYLLFCEQILAEIENILAICPENSELLNIKSKVKLIMQFHANTKDSGIWESKLFEILSCFDEFVKTNVENGQTIADEIRNRLQSKFNQI